MGLEVGASKGQFRILAKKYYQNCTFFIRLFLPILTQKQRFNSHHTQYY